MSAYSLPQTSVGEEVTAALSREAPGGRLVVLLPALNEERAIGEVLDRIPRDTLREGGYATSVWVLDGKSTDTTRQIALQEGAGVLVQRGAGKGNGVAQAFDYFLDADPPYFARAGIPRYFVMLDSDGTYPPEAIPRFLAALRSGHDVVMGSRFRGHVEEGALTPLNRLGNRLLTGLARFLYRVPVSDVCTGMWGFTEKFLERLGPPATGFDFEAHLFASACQSLSRIEEIPIRYSRRRGTAKLVPLRTGLLIAWRLVTRWLRDERPHQPSGRTPRPEELPGETA